MKYHDRSRQAIKIAGKLARVRKIAILQASAPGDFIFTLPALEALRHTYPRAEFVLLGQEWHATFLHGRPSPIDRVVVVPDYCGAHETDLSDQEVNELTCFFARMQAERFDLALQMQRGGRDVSTFLLRLQARVSAGYATSDGPQLDRSLLYTPFQHEILRWQEVATLVGVAKEACTQPELVVIAKDLEESLRVVAADPRPLVVLHPGSDDPRCRWPGQHFAAVGDALAREGMRIAITGSEQEVDLATGVARQMRAPALNVAGKLSYAGLCGLLSRCRLVIANDAAIQQLASCVGTATIGLYWCVNMLSSGPLNRQRHLPFISWQLHCPTCDHNQLYGHCGHLASLITDISSDEVISSARELLRA
ncbi:LPS biosynthesis-related glycosyltransferase [Dictyobacter sp. S3.2.2.5]|uniref:LPS biosynthesis-related glycosyltransferase n=1 Tax=Dictyobacter halimunensis TaxID=3026934 RepID=A0ABQ6FMQ0_9CHLR|nr:LPS biosynthesis-related glycosyltransferase [Dictyobacter sp. S3.2.2.5]GLV54890.1 LPS biosynthesis-related glycosyltransferase [Dictyobacter sp. S3.2.2.5]